MRVVEKLLGHERLLEDVELVILDFNGVIIDDLWVSRETVDMVLYQYDREPLKSPEVWREHTRVGGLIGFYRSQGIMTRTEALLREHYEAYGKLTSLRLVTVTFDGINWLPGRRVWPEIYWGAKEALMKMDTGGLSLAIVSQHPENFLLEEIGDFGIPKDIFKLIFAGVGNKVEPMREVMRQLNIDKDQTAIVGDMTWDILAGQEVGARTIAVTCGYHLEEWLKQEKPTRIISSLADLPQMISVCGE